jgi:hypothetical protein
MAAPRVERPLLAGFQELRLHTAPGVLVQRPEATDGAAEALRAAGSVELIRPYHGVVVHGDMAGDLGAAYSGDTPRPDLTMVTLAAVLRAAGRSVSVHDLNAEQRPWRPADRIPDVRLVKVQLPTWKADLEFAQELARACPESPVVLFGAVVTHLPDAHGFPLVRGDAPSAVAALLGVTEVAVGEAYTAFPVERYRTLDGELRLHLQSSRGCDRTCRYCPYIRTLGRWSGRSVAGFRHDVARLAELGATEIQLRDQDFPSDPDHALETAGVMAAAGDRLRWSVEGNLDRFTPRLLEELPGNGRTEVIVGLESADPAVLRAARRKVLQETRAFVQDVRRARLRIRGLFVLGLPGDSWAGAVDTVRLALELELDAVQFNVYAPLPGERFGNAVAATVHDYVPFQNHFLHRTCEGMSQKEVRLAVALANRAFAAYRAGHRSAGEELLGRMRRRIKGS